MRGWNRCFGAFLGIGILAAAAAALVAAAPPEPGREASPATPVQGASAAKPAAPEPASAPPNKVETPAPAQHVVSATVHSAGSGRPIQGARVEIFAVLDPEAALDRRAARDLVERPIASATTGASGAFSVAVPAGTRLAIVAEAKGLARSRLGRPVTLTEDRDLGRFDLPRGRRISGKVVDGAGRIVAGATVVASVEQGARRIGGGASFVRRMVTAGPAPFPSFAQTAADGSFVFETIPERPVSLRAFAPGFAPALVGEVRASTGIVVRLEPGHPVQGRVTAPDGKTAVEGAWVLAGDDGWDGATRSAADGTFRFDRLRSGAVSIAAALPMAVIADPPPAPAGGQAKGAAPPASLSMLAPSAPVSLSLPAPAKSASPVLRLRSGGVVRARVVDAETREPVAGTLLTLDAPGERRPRPATTGARGEVIFPGVPVGHVEITAEADGYLDEEVPSFSLASGQAREVSAALSPAASVEGTVRDRSGRPVAGATVGVSGPPPVAIPLPIPIFFPIGVDPVTTDTQGRFVLETLPPRSELKISVASPAFAPWDEAGIKLRPGERRKGMEVLLDAGEVISGRLLDGDGRPVAAASITASRRREEGPGGMVIRIDRGGGRGGASGGGPRGRGGPMQGEALPPVLTGDDGVFHVRGVTAGIWSLDVESEGFAPKNVGGLKIESGGLDVGDVTLDPGAILGGYVMAASGEPVPFARCRVTKDFASLAEATTGGDGGFAIRSLAPGETITLAVDADGFGSVEKPGLTPPLEGVTITLAPASQVSGKVVDKETGRAVPDFSIAVSRSRGAGGGAMRMNMEVMGPETSFHSDDGSFTLEDVDPGKVSLAARASGFREAQLREVEVPEGKDVTGLSFALDRAAHVAGTVTDPKGRPVPGATVEKKESSTGGTGRMVVVGGGGGRRTASDGDGNFILEGLDRERMTLAVSHPEYQSATVDVDTARDVENLAVSLSRGGAISGVVIHEEDGSPIDRATITATPAGGSPFSGGKSATAGPDGAFTLEALASGRYTLHAEAAGLTPANLDVVVDPATEPASVELKMAGGVTLSGTITGVKESQLPDFTVRALSGAFGKSAPVDASGSFEMKGLSPGTVTLMASSGIFGGRSMAKTIDIPKGVAAVEATIEFPRGNAVSGAVTRGETPVAGASVIFRNAVTRTSSTATTDAGGRYTAEDLESGDYDVNVIQFSSGISHSTKTKVDADEEFDIDLPLRKLSGRVVEAGSSKPVEGAAISIEKSGDRVSGGGAGPIFRFSRGARTDPGGAFQIDGLEEGSYDLTARKDHFAGARRSATIVDGAEPGEVVFQLAPGEEIAFQAIDSKTGRPLAGITALVTRQAGGDPLAPGAATQAPVFQGEVSPDASGLFRIDTLPAGTFDLTLGGQGLGTETRHGVKVPSDDLIANLAGGGTLEVQVAGLAPSQTASGVLLDPGGKTVLTNLYSAKPVFEVRQNQPLRLGGVKPGSYTVRVALPAGGMVEKPVTVAADAEVKLTFP